MAQSVVDHTVAPPGYSSQRDPPDSPTVESTDTTDVPSSPLLLRSRTAASNRRRYTSLPYSGSTVTFPIHLAYHPTDVDSTPETDLDPPVPSHPRVQQLHQKLASASTGPTIRLNPANYILLSRKGTPKPFSRTSASIKGKFTVNPYLHVPAALLAPLRDRDAPDGARKNLRLEVENGGINVEIFLVGEPDQHLDPVLRTSLDLRIRNAPNHASKKNKFPLVAKIHTPTPHRPPFHLCASAHEGYLSLHLPPSFHGLLTINVKPPTNDNPHLPLDAHISLSPAFAQNSLILSETPATRAYFVGEMGGWGREQQEWTGDRADVGVGGGFIRLQVLGESGWDAAVRRIRWRIGF